MASATTAAGLGMSPSGCSVAHAMPSSQHTTSKDSGSTTTVGTFLRPTDQPKQRGVPANASDAAERTLQRFWRNVSVQLHPATNLPAHYTIHLDQRALRTPSANVLRIPADQGLLAGLIAQEWHEQRTVLKPHALPLTSLVARSIDGLSSDSVRKGVCEGLLHYLDTDTILFHEDEPHQLVRLQDERWQPLLDWASNHFNQPITIYKSLFNTSQPEPTRAAFLAHILTLPPLRLAAFERAVLSSKSFLIALGLLEGKLSVDDAGRAAEVEVASQIERWGEVEDTHDVDYHDIRRQLGSVSIVLAPPVK
ncbi:unnamed protein product [Tilletia caries]|nr:unnamed protein product [Tilletia caries]